MKNFKLAVVAFFLGTTGIQPAALSQEIVRQHSYKVFNAAPVIQPAEGRQMRIKGRDTVDIGIPGQPAVPVKIVRIALPLEADPSTVQIKVRPLKTRVLPKKFDLAPVSPKVQMQGGRITWRPNTNAIVSRRDVMVYGQNAFFPGTWAEVTPHDGQLRQLRYRTLRLYPVRFHPLQKKLKYAEEFEIELSFKSASGKPAQPLLDCAGQALARELFFNYDQVESWYKSACVSSGRTPLTDTPKNVAIIMTESLKRPSSMLDDYIQLREQQGYELEIYTEDDWDIPTGKLLDSRADRIRNWLKNNYLEKNLGYAFLMGNPNPSPGLKYGIPMKLCGTHDDSDMGPIVGPTDFYYADLSGTWDDNNNGVVCEYGVDNVDFTPEIYVGRIPIYSDGAQALDGILKRIIDYEEESASGDLSWRRRMLLPNSIYFFEAQAGTRGNRWDGASTGEYFVREQLTARGMEWTTLYETEGLKPSIFESHFPINGPNLVDQWVRGYGLVFWAGHGSNTGVYRSIWTEDPNEDGVVDYREMSSPEFMTSEMLHMLEDAPPPFVVHGSCSNGTPEDPGNLGYSMLRRGAIATLSASRLALAWHFPEDGTERWEKIDSWDGCVLDIVTDYAVNILNGMEAGRALGTTIAKTTDLSESVSWFQKSIQNLYGDPLMRLATCRSDADCANGIACDGREVCDSGTCVPGEPVVCQPEDDCAEMVCAEGEGCVPASSCLAEMDAGTDDASPSDSQDDSDSNTSEDSPDGGGVLNGVSGCTTYVGNPSPLSPLPRLIEILLR